MAVAAIVRLIYGVCCPSLDSRLVIETSQRLESITRDYLDLRNTVLELVDELDNVREAKKNFNSANVRRALNKLVDLIISASEELIRFYKRSKSSKPLFS